MARVWPGLRSADLLRAGAACQGAALQTLPCNAVFAETFGIRRSTVRSGTEQAFATSAVIQDQVLIVKPPSG
jgi:hypothetical protein